MDQAQQPTPRTRRRMSSPRIAYTVGGLLTIGTASAITVATVLSSPQLDSVPLGASSGDPVPAANERALDTRPTPTTVPRNPGRGVVIPVEFRVPVQRPQLAAPAPAQPRPQVLGTQYAQPQRPPARPVPAPQAAAPAQPPAPRCGTGSALASLISEVKPNGGTLTTDYTSTLTATVDNRVTNAIQMDQLAVRASWDDGSSQVIPLSSAVGSVIQSGQGQSFVGSVTSATPPSSFTIEQFGWHVAGAPHCTGH